MQLPLRPMQAMSLQAPPSEEGAWYPSLILDFTDGKELIVGVPMSKGTEILIDAGSRVALEIPLPDGLRRFTAVVRRRTSSPPALYLSWPETGVRIQRRDSVRVETVFRVELELLGPGGGVQHRVPGLSSDLSEGGMRVVVPEAIEPGTDARLTMQLPSIGPRTAVGHILRRGDMLPPVGDNRYWIAIQFTDVTDAVRREITRLVFDIQREQRRKI